MLTFDKYLLMENFKTQFLCEQLNWRWLNYCCSCLLGFSPVYCFGFLGCWLFACLLSLSLVCLHWFPFFLCSIFCFQLIQPEYFLYFFHQGCWKCASRFQSLIQRSSHFTHCPIQQLIYWTLLTLPIKNTNEKEIYYRINAVI